MPNCKFGTNSRFIPGVYLGFAWVIPIIAHNCYSPRLYVPKPFGLRGVVIFQGFAVMKRLGTPNKQTNILEYCSPPLSEPPSEEDAVKKRAAEAQKEQEVKAARQKKEQERAKCRRR